MNRNQMYNYLKSLGMKPIIHRRGKKGVKHRSYHVEFVIDRENINQTIRMIMTDWGYIRGFQSIHLCKEEIVVVSDYGTGKINMYYKDINKFEVIIDEIDEDEYLIR